LLNRLPCILLGGSLHGNWIQFFYYKAAEVLVFQHGHIPKKKKRLQNGNEKLVLDEEPVSKTRYEANLSATAVEGIEPQTDIFT
jgi:hypothetical protein